MHPERICGIRLDTRLMECHNTWTMDTSASSLEEGKRATMEESGNQRKKQKIEGAGIQSLPPEVLKKILEYSPMEELLPLREISTAFKKESDALLQRNALMELPASYDYELCD